MSTSAIPEDAIIEASSGKWLRFNDNLVDEFTMSDSSLEAECFGGSYKAKANDGESWSRGLHAVENKNVVIRHIVYHDERIT